ncbi:MAG TPA: hypothetical protein VFO66_01450 [Gemmatimonadaceae bacterium]|nr:hypothetical protein [Gemmatimonadaceae bacterium]
MRPLNDDLMMAHMLLSIPLATGIAQVSSAMSRWPERLPDDRAQRLAMTRALLPKATKALGGSALVDLSLAAILGLFIPLVWAPLLVAGAVLLAIYSELPSGFEMPWAGVRAGRLPQYARWIRGSMLVAVAITTILMVMGRVAFSAFLVAMPLLFSAGILHRWATTAVAELRME